MRVVSEALGGTPFDAAGPKGADGTPGDATAAGAGFFALLALLQAGGVAGEAAAGVADGVAPDEGAADDDAPAADGADASALTDGADVVVTLSGAAAAAAAATAAVAVATAAEPAAAAPSPAGAATARIDAQAFASRAASGVPAGPAAPALPDAAPSVSTGAVAAPPVASAVPIAAEAATAASEAAPAATPARVAAALPSERVHGAAAQDTVAVARSGAPVAVDAAGTAAAVRAGQAAAPQASREPDARATRQTTIAADPEPPQVKLADGPPDGDAAADDGAERRDGARDGFVAARPATAPSADRLAPGAGVEPAAAATPGETTPSSAELVPPARDTQKASEVTSRAANGAQRAALADGGSLPGWIERLTDPQRLASARRTNALRFDLEPAGLGRIEVRLSFGRDGVRAQVFAEHEHTRALIAQQQPQLAGAFERNDLRLESFLVDLGFGGEGSGEARRDVEDPEAFALALARTAPAEQDVAPASIPTVTGLLSVRA